MGCVPIPAGALALRGAASAVSALLDVGIFIFSFMTTGSRDPAREGWGMADEPRGIASCGTLPVARSGAEGGATSASGADAPRGEGGMARTRAALRATTGSRDPAREGWGMASADEPRGIASCGTCPVARAGVEGGATSASGADAPRPFSFSSLSTSLYLSLSLSLTHSISISLSLSLSLSFFCLIFIFRFVLP